MRKTPSRVRAGREGTNLLTPGANEADALVAFVFGEAKPTLPATRERFRQACETAWKGWQVLGSTAPRILDWGGQHARSAAGQQLRQRAAGVDLYANIQDRLCHRIVGELRQRSIPHVLLKGSAVRYTVYDRPQLRCGFDLDIGVPKSHLREAEKVVLGAGYYPAQWDPDGARFVIANPKLRSYVERAHYELGFLVRHHVVRGLPEPLLASFEDESPDFRVWHRIDEVDAGCYCAVDLHHAISHDIPLEPFLDSSVEQPSRLRTPTLDLQLFHLIFKFYWEGVNNYGKGLYQFTDLARLMPSIDQAIFDQCRKLLAQFHLEAAGYYVLRRLDWFLRDPVPEFLKAFITEMATVRPGSHPIAENDLGDFWAKLQGRR